LSSILGILDPFININTERPASKLLVTIQDALADCNCSTKRLLLHSIPHIAHVITLTATTYKRKEIEEDYIPPMPGLLTEK
jgi:hypothetical protein